MSIPGKTVQVGEEAGDDPEESRVIFCALESYMQYAKATQFNVTHMRRQSFYALPQSHWQLLASPPISFLETLDKTDDAIESNAELARNIAHFGLLSFGSVEAKPGTEPVMPDEWRGVAKHHDIEKTRSTLRQFFRDWSAEAESERAACYRPVFDAINAEALPLSDRRPLEVLVPGAGLGRLVFELALRGCRVEGNEISYHQLIASRYILNHCQRTGQHTIFPWIHTFSNHMTRENHLRSYRIPDVHPATALSQAGPTAGTMSMLAADFLCLYADEAHRDRYDAVASVFFLDTAPNLIRYLEVIWHCLRPGGVLINIGPLQWHFENNAPGHHGFDDDGDGQHDTKNSSSGIADPGSFELADDEVMALLKMLGFHLEKSQTGIETPYIQDSASMLLTTYKATAWVARKPEGQAILTRKTEAVSPPASLEGHVNIVSIN